MRRFDGLLLAAITAVLIAGLAALIESAPESPSHRAALIELATIAERRGAWSAAAQHLERAFELARDAGDPRASLERLVQLHERWQEAEPSADRAATLERLRTALGELGGG